MVGYIGGVTCSPTYREVCDQPNDAGHTEAIRVEFDPDVLPLDTIMQRFFAEATPNIRRMQYRSAVWVNSAAQAEIAGRAAKEAGMDLPILTAVPFHPAEERHQKYYEKQTCFGPRVCRRL